MKPEETAKHVLGAIVGVVQRCRQYEIDAVEIFGRAREAEELRYRVLKVVSEVYNCEMALSFAQKRRVELQACETEDGKLSRLRSMYEDLKAALKCEDKTIDELDLLATQAAAIHENRANNDLIPF